MSVHLKIHYVIEIFESYRELVAITRSVRKNSTKSLNVNAQHISIAVHKEDITTQFVQSLIQDTFGVRNGHMNWQGRRNEIRFKECNKIYGLDWFLKGRILKVDGMKFSCLFKRRFSIICACQLEMMFLDEMLLKMLLCAFQSTVESEFYSFNDIFIRKYDFWVQLYCNLVTA